MEILTPVQPVQSQESTAPTEIPQELADHGFTLRNLEILDYLDMSTEMFNTHTMAKVKELSYLLGDRNIQDIYLQLGNPYNLSRIDKIYTYLKLDSQTRALKEKEALLEREKNK